MFRRSIPLHMIWCKAPGASILAWRGMWLHYHKQMKKETPKFNPVPLYLARPAVFGVPLYLGVPLYAPWNYDIKVIVFDLLVLSLAFYCPMFCGMSEKPTHLFFIQFTFFEDVTNVFGYSCARQWDAHAIMRFVYRIEIVNALKPIMHIFELPCLPRFFNASTYHVMQCSWNIDFCFP